MKIFVTMVCFTLVAYTAARPGYNYQDPKQIVQQALQPSAQQSQLLAALNNQAQAQSIAAPQNADSLSPYQQSQQAIVNKEVFIHSSPEETEVIGEQKDADLGPARKNNRVILIKAPGQNIRLNVEEIQRAQASNEEKTVIYVLAKKPDLANIQNQLGNLQSQQKAIKPVVYFIKYKTQEEADRVQQKILDEYDALGDSTHVSDEGIAPIASVIGRSSASGGNSSDSIVGE